MKYDEINKRHLDKSEINKRSLLFQRQLRQERVDANNIFV